jgi:hypothetical protein
VLSVPAVYNSHDLYSIFVLGVTSADEWTATYWSQIERSHQHLAHIKARALQTALEFDSNNARALKMAEMVTLSVLTDLHCALASTSYQSRQSALRAALRLVEITRTFEGNDYGRLDPSLFVSRAGYLTRHLLTIYFCSSHGSPASKYSDSKSRLRRLFFRRMISSP